MVNQTTKGSDPVKLAEAAVKLMSDPHYKKVLEAAESCSKTKFDIECGKAGVDPAYWGELWAAAAGTQSDMALARYPGSAGW